MPRQPFLPTFSHLEYAFGALALNNRPELASAIGRCITIWSQADSEMAKLFDTLFGTNNKISLEVFLILRNSANQREALKAAAEIRLKGENYLFFEALMSLYKSLESERNALAHGCFGVAANDLDVLFWIDTRNHVQFQTDIYTKIAHGDKITDPHEHLKQNMYVYQLSDLNTLQYEMSQFWDATMSFNSYLKFNSDPHQLKVFNRIQKLPLIQAALHELRS